MDPVIDTATWSLSTPLGTMTASVTDRGVSKLIFAPTEPGDDIATGIASTREVAGSRQQYLLRLSDELSAYFRGELRMFTVPPDLRGTAFQRRVWELLLRIPYGETTTYGEIAGHLGDANAVRAVARANALNPVAVIVPCHRVIGAGGNLTGYAGGLWRKRRLLHLEATGSIDDPQTRLFHDS